MVISEVLSLAVQSYGVCVLKDKARLKSFLKDYQNKLSLREQSLLETAIFLNVLENIVQAPVEPQLRSRLAEKLCLRLMDDGCLAREHAEYLVQEISKAFQWEDIFFSPLVESLPSPPQTRRQVVKIHGKDYAFCWCPAGTFTMGSPETESGRDDDEILHDVTLSADFWMLETPVTQTLWRDVMGNSPSEFQGGDFPVEQVSWEECVAFCQKISQVSGKKMTLPTEAQWECACRAGTYTPYAGKLEEMGWYRGNSGGQTHAVREKKPNAWGLYDMHGNIWEWCLDGYSTFTTEPQIDPTGNVESPTRIIRGGSWTSTEENCRSAFRYNRSKSYRNCFVGLRICFK